jgi:hypothetical protein
LNQAFETIFESSIANVSAKRILFSLASTVNRPLEAERLSRLWSSLSRPRGLALTLAVSNVKEDYQELRKIGRTECRSRS